MCKEKFERVKMHVWCRNSLASLAVAILVVACSSSAPETPQPQTKVTENRPTAQETICKYNKDVLGLPLKFSVFGALDSIKASRDPRLSPAIQSDKKTILSLNTKHVCSCGTPVEKEEAQCAKITAG